MRLRPAILPLAAFVALCVSACSGRPATVVTVTIPADDSSAMVTSSPTPVEAVSIADARAIYLSAACPANGEILQVERTKGANLSWSTISQALQAELDATKAAEKIYSETPWPEVLTSDFQVAVTVSRENADYQQKLIDSGSVEAANMVPTPSTPGRGAQIRAGLKLPVDYVEACAGNMPSSFPKGYPEKVAVSSLPSSFAHDTYASKYVLQLAPGVWSELDPGATWGDTVAAQQIDGRCGSKKAYERQYVWGVSTSGSCS